MRGTKEQLKSRETVTSPNREKLGISISPTLPRLPHTKDYRARILVVHNTEHVGYILTQGERGNRTERLHAGDVLKRKDAIHYVQVE